MTLEKEKGVSSFPFCTYACVVGEKERNLLLILLTCAHASWREEEKPPIPFPHAHTWVRAREGEGREEINLLLPSLNT